MEYLLDYKIILPLVLLLGFAPVFPRPHIVEKLRMLKAGSLNKPVDIFDLAWHGWPFFLLIYRIYLDINF